MSVVAALLQLQEVDDQIRYLEKELKDLPCKKAQETARLSGVNIDLTAAKEGLAYVTNRVKGFESEAGELKEKVAQLKQTQMGLKSNKEYQQYSIQIDFVNHDIEVAESNQLAAMDDIPSAEKRLQDAQARYDQEKVAVDAVAAEIDERIEQVRAELAEAQTLRVEKVKEVRAINPRFEAYYERLKLKRWPVVSALTAAGVCDGCHLQQPPSIDQLVKQNVKRAKQGQDENIVACTMCGRILYAEF